MAVTPKKYLARVGGKTQQLSATAVSAGPTDAGKIAALGEDGRFDQSVMPTGVGPDVAVVKAGEALAAGNFVNIYEDTGEALVRKADNSNGRVAHGYVVDAVNLGENASIYPLDGLNTELSGLDAGMTYWLGTAGGVTDTPLVEDNPANANKVSQQLGIALAADTLRTDDYGYVIL